jgi:hypothetical protein
MITMVEILCPHCEEEIELEDDAKGEFACPYCEGEFEWGMDDEEDEFDFSVAEPSPRQDVLVEYEDIPAIRITAGSIFATVMGFYAAFVALPIIFGGLFVSSIEGAVDSGTGFGAIIILMGIVYLIFFVTGITFGIQMAKGHFTALIVCTVLSVISLIGTIVFWLMGNDSENAECAEWDYDSGIFGECVEYESSLSSVPIGGIIIFALLIAMNVSMLFVPKLRYQYY